MDNDGSEAVDETPDSWDWLTIMVGPEVSGEEKIWFGKREEPWEKIGDEGGIIVCAEPVEHIPLPRPMTRQELEDFFGEEWRQQILNKYTDTDGEINE